MPLSKLTLRDLEDLAQLQERLFGGDLLSRGFSGVPFVNKERDELSEFFKYGAELYGTEGVNALYYYPKTITANQ